MAEQSRFDVFFLQRFLEERIVEQLDLADRQIVRRPPIGIDPIDFFSGK